MSQGYPRACDGIRFPCHEFGYRSCQDTCDACKTNEKLTYTKLHRTSKFPSSSCSLYVQHRTGRNRISSHVMSAKRPSEYISLLRLDPVLSRRACLASGWSSSYQQDRDVSMSIIERTSRKDDEPGKYSSPSLYLLFPSVP